MRPALPALAALCLSVACGGDDAATTGSTSANGGGGASSGSAGAPGGTGGTAAGSGGTAAGAGGTAGAAGAAACSPACQLGFECCNGKCVNTDNDINNCGKCKQACTGGNPYCDQGTCGSPPCGGTVCVATKFCCGQSCCDIGDLCCDVPGPVSQGPKCQKPNAEGTCDAGCKGCVCDAPDTPIATATGERPIATLKVGDLVYSMHEGKVALVPIRLVHRVSASHHVVVRVELESGAVLHVSGPHPTADGRTFAALRAGQLLDGVRIRSTKIVPFDHDATYDILPASDTGTYFAGGVLIGSTLWSGTGRASSVAASAPMSVVAPK